MKKIVLAWMILVLGLMALVYWLGTGSTSLATKKSEYSLINAEFTLVGAQGKTVSQVDFHGKYMLVFFGFTHCPDICPTTLLMLQNTLGHMGDLAKKIQTIFITVDPERDTPAITSAYASRFGTAIGLSGSAEQIKNTADNFKIYYSKIENPDATNDYMVDHSSFIFLIGPDGKYITHFTNDTPPQALEESLKKLVK